MNQDLKDKIDPTASGGIGTSDEKKWYKRDKDGIFTPTKEKKETPDGLWVQCPKCKSSITQKELTDNLEVCPNCEYHFRVGSAEYFSFLFDDGEFTELDSEMRAADPLNFTDKKPYVDRLQAAQEKTSLKDAARTAYGRINGQGLIVACMDFSFIGGSMGSVVGEKIGRAIDHALKHKTALLIISKSGGARMMEAAFSLMQMAKTSAKLALLSRARVPFISLMTDPTTGGVTASYAMLGDINLGEPGALIGFAGPRVIKETIKQDLPEGFQTSEFLLEHGLLDMIVNRHELKDTLSGLISHMKLKPRRKRANKA